MPDQPQGPPQIDFYKYFRILWRRKWLLAVPLVLCLVLGVILALNHPLEYESRAVLEAAVTNPLGPGHTKRRVNVMAEVRDVKNTMVAFSTLRDIIVSRKLDFGEEVDPEDSRQIEKLYRRIRRHTHIRPMSRRYLAVSHRSPDPELNAELVNEMVKRFVGEDKQEAMKQAQVDLEFNQDQYEKARSRLAEVDSQLRDFSQSHPGFRDEITEIYYDHREAREEEQSLREQIEELEAAIQGLRKDLANEPEKLVETRPGQVPAEVRDARTAVEQAEQRFRAMNERYTPAHRRWQEAKQDYDRAVARLRQVDTGAPDEEVIERDNPRRVELETALEEAESKLERLNVKLLAQNKAVSEKYDLLRRAPELLTEKRRLEEERENCAYLCEDYARGLREAEKELKRLSTEAYSAKYRVREYARVSRMPIRETKLKILMMAGFVGLIIGVGLIVLVEYLDQTFKTVDDVRETLGLPALGVIPAIYTPRDHRRRLWFRVLAFSSGVFVIGVGVFIYLFVPEVQVFVREQVWGGLQSMISSW
jgi:uncharacterized protein involved in exopolysaccharide biosynthesis